MAWGRRNGRIRKEDCKTRIEDSQVWEGRLENQKEGMKGVEVLGKERSGMRKEDKEPCMFWKEDWKH